MGEEPAIDEGLLYDSIYIKFMNRHKSSVITEVTAVVSLRGGVLMTGR